MNETLARWAMRHAIRIRHKDLPITGLIVSIGEIDVGVRGPRFRSFQGDVLQGHTSTIKMPAACVVWDGDPPTIQEDIPLPILDFIE